MRRNLIILGLALLGAFELSQSATAQENPPVIPVAKRSIGHVIKLAQPFGPETTLEARLEAKASFQAEGATLQDFAVAVEVALDTSVLLAKKKLEASAVNIETPMTYRLKNVRVQTALKLILGELGLTYVLHDSVMMITTTEDAESQLVTRVYDCRELLKAPSSVTRRRLFGGGLGGGANSAAITKEGKADDAAQSSDYSADELLEIIETTVHPDNWFDGNNNHSADFKGLLIILQSQEMHADIEKLLNQLHNACGIEKKVKVFR